MNKTCPNCQSETHLIEGVSKKNNKPYKGYKCDNCDKIVEWVNDKRNYSPKQAINSPSKEEYANLMVANRELYLLMKVIAFKVGLSERDITDDLTKLKEKNG